MLLNHLKVAVRSFRKNALYASLNVLGMAIAFAAFGLILIYIQYESSYESFHSKSDRIFRPTYFYQSGGDYEVQWARIPVNYINELPEDIPEVEKLIRFQNPQ